MTRLRQKYKNLKKLLGKKGEPLRVYHYEYPAVATLECNRVFSTEMLYNLHGGPQTVLPMVTEMAAADLCRQIISGDLIDIEVEDENSYETIYRVRLKVIAPK